MPSTYNERIHQLLDGELDSPGEAILFSELAQNSELRSEFMQLLAIRTAVQQDRALLIPPVSLTSSVFAGLGIASPLAGAAAGIAAGAAGGAAASTWISKIIAPAIAALAAAGITYGIVASSEQRVASSEQRVVSAEQRVASTEQRTASAEQRAASAEQRAASAEQRAASAEQRVPSSEQRVAGVQQIVVEDNRTEVRRLRNEVARLHAELATLQHESEASTEIQNNIVPEEYVEREARATPIDINHTVQIARESDAGVVLPIRIAPIVPEYQDYPSFLVQFRGLASSGITSVNVAPQKSLLENANLALMYQLSPKHLIGVEVGSESFPMSFEGTRNGQLIRYEQQPVSTWAGVTYRYSFPPIGNSAFTPFAQGLIGGSQFGPLGRATGGLQYSPAGPLTFMLGVEGTTMAYTHQNRWFTSSKIGLTYGMAIRF